MRAKRPEGSIRERSKGNFQIRYNLGVDPLTGQRKRIEFTHNGTRETAKAELRSRLKSIDDNRHIEPNKTKLSEYITEWLETMRSQVSPKTHERYSELVRNTIIPALGHHILSKLEATDIQQAYNKWMIGGRRDKKKGGLSPRTRLHLHRVFKLALKHAVKLKLIASNPAEDVIPPRAKKATVNTLTVEESAKLLAALRGTVMYWPVLLAIATGMRRGEIVALRWKHVDFEKRTIRVMESVEQVGHSIRLKPPKTDRTRAILLPDYAVQELKEWKETQAKELAELGVEATDRTFVCGRSWDGGVLKPDSLTAEFRVAIRRIPDIPVLRFHDLRHSHATQLLSEGIHPKIAQERLGHSTITTTLDLYSHFVDTMQDSAVEKMNEVFRAATQVKTQPPKPRLG